MGWFFKEVFLSKLFLFISMIFLVSFAIKYIETGTWFLFGIKIILFTILFAIGVFFGLNTYEKSLLKGVLLKNIS